MLEDKNKLKAYLSDRKKSERSETLNMLDRYAINENQNIIHFIMLWGAGSKIRANKADKDTLLYLFHFLKQIEVSYKMHVDFTLIFADTHTYLNGYNIDNAHSYFNDIKYHLKKHQFNYQYSSNLCEEDIQNAGFKDYMSFINEIILDINNLFQYIGLEENQITNFYKYAQRHCNRIKKNEDGLFFKNEEDAAKAYLFFADFEKDIITKRHPNALFITYMSREEEFALPNLPIIRLYSLKSGLRTRPWFVE